MGYIKTIRGKTGRLINVSKVRNCGGFSGEPQHGTAETLAPQWFDAAELPDKLNPCDARALCGFASRVS